MCTNFFGTVFIWLENPIVKVIVEIHGTLPKCHVWPVDGRGKIWKLHPIKILSFPLPTWHKTAERGNAKILQNRLNQRQRDCAQLGFDADPFKKCKRAWVVHLGNCNIILLFDQIGVKLAIFDKFWKKEELDMLPAVPSQVFVKTSMSFK